LVDNAIVVVENIERYLEEGHKRTDAVIHATSEIIPPLLGATLTTLVVFVPLVFLSGVPGIFFRALASTLAIAIFAIWSAPDRVCADEPFVTYSLYRVDSTEAGLVETHVTFKDTLDLQERVQFRLYVTFLASNSTVNQSNDKLVKGLHVPNIVTWKDVFSDYGWGRTVRVPFTINTEKNVQKTGKYSFDIVAQVLKDNSSYVVLSDTIQFNFWIRPFLKEEPKFTRGSSNTVVLFPSDSAFSQEVICNATTMHLGKLTGHLYQRDVNFNDLSDGQRYLYYVETVLQTSEGTTQLLSDTVYSIQDATPPQKVVFDLHLLATWKSL